MLACLTIDYAPEQHKAQSTSVLDVTQLWNDLIADKKRSPFRLDFDTFAMNDGPEVSQEMIARHCVTSLN